MRDIASQIGLLVAQYDNGKIQIARITVITTLCEFIIVVCFYKTESDLFCLKCLKGFEVSKRRI